MQENPADQRNGEIIDSTAKGEGATIFGGEIENSNT